MTILLAEDEIILLKTMTYRLMKDGHEVLLAEDGNQAMEKVRSAQPDLIISDLNMPGVSGMDLLGLVRQQLGLTIPFILLTGTRDEEVRKKAFALGVTDCLVKPFSPNALAELVKKYGA